MSKVMIATNNEHIWFGDTAYVNKQPYTQFCIEDMSDEMYNVLFSYSQQEEHSKTISILLYGILDQKGLSNN